MRHGEAALGAIPSLTRVVTAHGGHCGFIGRASGDDDGYWAERRVVDFVAAQAGPQPFDSSSSIR